MKPGDIEIQINVTDTARQALENGRETMQEFPSVVDIDLAALAEAFSTAGLTMTEFATAFQNLERVVEQWYEEFWQLLYEGLARVRAEMDQCAVSYTSIDMRAVNLFYLELGEWRLVDPRELTPEQRWRYQKLVLSAPFRWVWGRLRRG